METGTEVTVEVVEDCLVAQGDLVTAFSAALLVWRLSLMNGVFLFSVNPLTKHVVLTPKGKKNHQKIKIVYNANSECWRKCVTRDLKWKPLQQVKSMAGEEENI